MSQLTMEEFFDSKSASWDEGEVTSTEQRREFLSFLDIKKGEAVLDLACGTGVITPLLEEKSHSKVIGLDLSSKMIEIAKSKFNSNPNLDFKSGDFLKSDLKGFDWIIIYNAYPHFLDRVAFKKKALSALNEGGKLAILHSLSRQELATAHAGQAHPYSRDLENPLNEGNIFLPEMKILLSDEGEHSFRLILQKR